MAVYADIVRIAAGSGTQPVPGSLNGETPTTAIVLGCSATATNTIADHCLSIRGVLASGSSQSRGDLTGDQVCGVTVSGNGDDPTNPHCGVFLGKFLAVPQLSTVDGTVAATAVATPVPDGLSLAWTGTPPAVLLDILLIAGDTSESHVHYEHDNPLNFTMTTGFALTPDVFLMGFSVTKSGPVDDDVLTKQHALHGFGLYNNGNYGCKVLSSSNNQSRAICYNAHFNDRVIGGVNHNSTSGYGYIVESSDATSITFGPPGANSQPENNVVVAVKLGGRNIDLRTITAPSSPQLQPITGLGFDPDYAILLGGDSDALGGSKSSTRSLVAKALHKGGDINNRTVGCWDQDGAKPTYAKGRTSSDYNWYGIGEQDNIRWECDFSCETDGYHFDWASIKRTSGTFHVVLSFDVTPVGQSGTFTASAAANANFVGDLTGEAEFTESAPATAGFGAIGAYAKALTGAVAAADSFMYPGYPSFTPVAGDWVDRGVAIAAGTGWDVRLGGAVSPCVCLKKASTWYLFYIGADGDRSSDGGPRHRALGMATSSDGLNFTKAANNPIITHLPNSAEEEGVFSAGGFVEDSGRIVIYYGAMEDTGGGQVDIYICLAFSDDDGATWTNRGDTQTYALVSAGDEFSPIGVFKVGTTYYCYYIDNEATWNLRLASGTLESLTDAGDVTGLSGGQAKGGGNIIYTDPNGAFLTFINHYNTRDPLVCTGDTATPLVVTEIDRYPWGAETHRTSTTMYDSQGELFYMYINDGENNQITVKTAPPIIVPATLLSSASAQTAFGGIGHYGAGFSGATIADDGLGPRRDLLGDLSGSGSSGEIIAALAQRIATLQASGTASEQAIALAQVMSSFAAGSAANEAWAASLGRVGQLIASGAASDMWTGDLFGAYEVIFLAPTPSSAEFVAAIQGLVSQTEIANTSDAIVGVAAFLASFAAASSAADLYIAQTGTSQPGNLVASSAAAALWSALRALEGQYAGDATALAVFTSSGAIMAIFLASAGADDVMTALGVYQTDFLSTASAVDEFDYRGRIGYLVASISIVKALTATVEQQPALAGEVKFHEN